jgi:hypothetical protein
MVKRLTERQKETDAKKRRKLFVGRAGPGGMRVASFSSAYMPPYKPYLAKPNTAGAPRAGRAVLSPQSGSHGAPLGGKSCPFWVGIVCVCVNM